jgi:hypothetical protein
MARQFSLILGAALAFLAIAYVIYDAWAWDHAAKVVDSGFRRLATAQSNDRPGGIYLEADSYYWLSYAKRIGQGETLRVRYTFADNAPFGRQVHWSQSVSWLLVIFGKVRQAICGGPWQGALESASVWVNPILLTVLVCGFGWVLFRRVGPLPAGLFTVYFVSLGDVGWTFQPLRPGHQALYCLFGMSTLMGLVLGGVGWIRTGSSESLRNSLLVRPLEIPLFPSARRWFVFSGVCTGLGLWISAVVSTMLLALLFTAGLLLAVCAPKLPADSDIQIKPELWRWWGLTGAAGSFFFYLLEYFPNHLSLFRLEVNGPLYSVMVAAMGEGMCQFLKARHAARTEMTIPFIRGAACTALVALVPIAILLGPQAWHALRDPEMLRLHNFIQEFYSFPRFAGSKLWRIVVENFGIAPLFLILAIGLAAFSNLRLHEWSVMWLSFAVAVGMLGFGYFQVRWLGLFAATNAWLAVVVGVCAWRLLSERLPPWLQTIASVLCVTLLLIQPVMFGYRRYKQVSDIIHQRTLPKEVADPVLNKRLALAFVAAEGPGARVMADLDFAPALHYFAQSSAVASFYWENIQGLHATTAFFVDSGDDMARQVALDRGLTHVIVQEGNRLQNYFYVIATGKIDELASRQTLAARLVGSEFLLPPWIVTSPILQQIGYQVYAYGGMPFEERWRIYRISLRP